MITPTLHMNGSSYSNLSDGYRTAHDAVVAALDATAATAPNARDYYPKGDYAAGTAMAEHRARMEKLRAVAEELALLGASVIEQQDERARRRST